MADPDPVTYPDPRTWLEWCGQLAIALPLLALSIVVAVPLLLLALLIDGLKTEPRP
jgi:hypothetical protein